MTNKRIQDFFNGRFFEIPKYQRGFAWEKRNVRELFDDIQEAIDTNSHHYIGTFVLSNKQNCTDHFFVVDGQQRITTITLIINALISKLGKNDRDYYKRFYIREGKAHKLIMLGKDNDYLTSLLSDKVHEPENKSQRLLKDAYEEIHTLIDEIDSKKNFMRYVEKLEIMEFIEKSEGDAIRIFQTVNDRGKPLSSMEKAKSLLIYFSNKYLGKVLDTKINDVFGEIFEIYDDIKHIGETLGIPPIKNRDFNEDDIMRYHFLTFSDANYDASAAFVLDFLKEQLTSFRKKNQRKKMKAFIKRYFRSLLEFFVALKALTEKAQEEEIYYKLFCILGISATLYPLMVRLEILDLLEENLTSKDCSEFTFLDLLEHIDVRVYKTRGTDPRAEISRYAYEINEDYSKKEIQNWLLEYNRRWMSNEEFITNLNSSVYGNRALPFIFITLCEIIDGKGYPIKRLKKFVNKKLTIEHVLSQQAKFTYKSAGFKGSEHFLEHKDKLGNLTILEKGLNSAAWNKLPVEKVPYYDRSDYTMTRKLSTYIQKRKVFKKGDIDDRTKKLSKQISQLWWC